MSGLEMIRSENNQGGNAPRKLEQLTFDKGKKPRRYKPKVMYEYRMDNLDEHGKPKYKKITKPHH